VDEDDGCPTEGEPDAPAPVLSAGLDAGENPAGTDGKKHKRKNDPGRRGRFKRANLALASAIALATIAQGFFASRQYDSMQAALRETRESNQLTRWNVETTLRPWIMVDQWTWLGTNPETPIPPAPLVGEDIVAVQVAVRNTGQLPGVKMYGSINATTLPVGERFPDSPTYPPWRNPGSIASIAPNQVTSWAVNVRDLPLAEVGAERRMLYVYGYLIYWDQFWVQRGLVFCGMWGSGTPGGWTQCPTYNLPW
jgi:hypothetical protein